jgi:hypothetical protein
LQLLVNLLPEVQQPDAGVALTDYRAGSFPILQRAA